MSRTYTPCHYSLSVTISEPFPLQGYIWYIKYQPWIQYNSQLLYFPQHAANISIARCLRLGLMFRV